MVNSVFRGCPLIGAITEYKLINGGFYTVVDFGDGKVILKNIENDEEITLTQEQLRHCRLGFSCTYASIQSRTLHGRIRLWDHGHPKFTSRHLAMGLGRATSAAAVDLA